MKKILLFLSVILLIAGCASKRYTKKAAKFEEAGLYEDAAAYYYEAVRKKDSNVDAKLGLRKTGQQTLDKKLSEFNIAYKQADYKKAVYNYIDAENYFNKIKAVNVELNFPEYYKEYYEESKNDYLNKKYTDGVDKLNRDDFAAALLVFEEIKKIDGNYKDVKDLYITAKYEPFYREANTNLDNGLYRKAYYTFDNILKGTGGYKQANTLKEEALQKGTITILVTDFQYSNTYTRNTSQAVTSKVRSQLSTSENPFIKIIDVSAINANIYQDGRLNMQAANLSGIKAILTGNVSRVVENTGKLNKTEKRGYIKEVRKVKNDKGEDIDKVEYFKTTYYEYEAENYASVELNFKLISTENNEILVSDLVSLTNNDKMHYASFSGEKKTLVPGYWKYKDRKSPEDNVKDNQSDINRLKNLLNASKDIKSTTELLDEVIKQSVQRISDKVNKYNPEK
ncbi:MAG: hypothetical protein A2X13_03040 [Bacteroidetes bacterium GWC2_33_15]|nr:MAG: hypothetical protein A2X10_09575 [Bacteroidetes bacterium GWA2_33_15]OFX49522.1 MAG: hypothetical protein A2X13_03040 [Bacteroidetes bacterium GWC2_33_15]OFX63639.1 MAG: hypothetical protein A2X15_01185 [Bacteroidetes bacterium GWB2_32_14]OFX68853.1 MAG: hypothetical protein A2X14_13180 [Bacteroidetes bacterium GWD2_33_33]HAN17550.1 hypothetical protein [Bacteroidales bacterium]